MSFRYNKLAALALGLVALLASPTPAQKAETRRGLTLADLAPQDLFLYASCAGLEQCSAAARGLGLYRLWQEKEVQFFLEDLVRAYREAAARVPTKALANWEEAKGLLGGRLSLILGDLTLVWQRDHPMVLPSAVLALDVAGRKEAFRSRLEQLLDRLLQSPRMRGLHRSVSEYEGHQVLVLEQREYFPQLSLCAAFVDDLFLVGLNRSLLQRCLDRVGKGGEGSLARLPSFRRARAHAGGTALLELFLNLGPTAGRLRGLVPAEALAAMRSLGLDRLYALYWSSAVKEGDTFDTIYLDAPAPRPGLLHLFSGRLHRETLALVPAEALYCEAFNLRPGPAWQGLRAALGHLLSPAWEARLQRKLEEIEQRAGLDLEKDLLAALRGEWLVYCRLRPAALVPDLVLVGRIAREKGEKLLARLHTAAGIGNRRIEYRQQEITILNMPGKGPLRPAYAWLGNRLFFALTPAGLKGALRHVLEGERSALEQPAFRETFSGLEWEGAASMSYVDMKRLVGIGYGWAERFLPVLAKGADLPLRTILMPSRETMVRHLRGMGQVMEADDQGITVKGRVPGMALVLALTARFLARAPGIPPLVLERLGRRLERGDLAPGAGKRTL